MAAQGDANPGDWLTSPDPEPYSRMPTSTPMTPCARRTPIDSCSMWTVTRFPLPPAGAGAMEQLVLGPEGIGCDPAREAEHLGA